MARNQQMRTKQTTGVRVSDLKDQLGTSYPRPFLYCRKCGGEYSAHAGDYFMLPAEHIMKCCHANMVLMTKREVYTEVQGNG